jgi:hypothetical protein
VDLVEGSTPSETEKEPTSNVSIRGAGNVEAPATLDIFFPTDGTKKDRKMLMFVHLD